MKIIEPEIEAMFRQIWSVLRHAASVVFPIVSQENPADMGPPRAIPRGVGIARLIRFLMMDPMRGYPENRAPFERQGATNRQEIFQSQWYLVGAMRVQAMVPHADAEASRHPHQKDGNGKVAPAEHE